LQAPTIWKFSLRYLALSLPAHLAWEIVQLPLYTLWNNPDKGAITFAVVHCTVGDLMIAACTLLLGWMAAGMRHSQRGSPRFMVIVTMALGVVYTIVSEWNNTVVLGSWTYSALMPQVFGIGVSPIAQWIVIPGLLFAALRKHLPKAF
jgi:hypothetical protein